jgi:hypothetical protein
MTVDRFLGEMRRASELVQERRFDEAIQVYRALIAEGRPLDLDTGHLHWACGVACDYAGELEMAFEEVTTAMAKDPLCLPFRSSFDVVTGRIRTALAEPGRAPDEPSTPRLYALLVRADEADVAAHLAMARYHLATGHPELAVTLVDAVTLLHPWARRAWTMKAELAAAAGDAAGAEHARLEAAALGDGEPSFAIPGAACA